MSQVVVATPSIEKNIIIFFVVARYLAGPELVSRCIPNDEMFLSLCAELLAIDLLDFIHVYIEDASKLVDEALHEKCLRDYLEAHLDGRDDNIDDDAMVSYVDEEFMIGHAIALFDFIVKELRERS